MVSTAGILKTVLLDTKAHIGGWWKSASGVFVILDISVGYEWAKVYCKAKFNTPDAPCITEIKTTRKTGLCYKCGGLCFQLIAQATARTNPKPIHQYKKLTKETTTQTNFITIKAMTWFQRESFHSRCPNWLGQVKICQQVLRPLHTLCTK